MIGIHPGVAEAGRTAAGATLQQAVDRELAATWRELAERGHRGEAERDGSAGQMIVHAGIHAFPYLSRLGDWGNASTMLERSLGRDGSPRTVGAVLPLLRQVVRATEGTLYALEDRGVLANGITGWRVPRGGRAGDACRSGGCGAAGDFDTASSAAGDLINLLQAAAHSRKPWSSPNESLISPVARDVVRGRRSRTNANVCRYWATRATAPKSCARSTNYACAWKSLPDPPDENDRAV